jgi:hypothetical protein
MLAPLYTSHHTPQQACRQDEDYLERFVLPSALLLFLVVHHPGLQARWFNKPDVWTQLLRHLLRDAACRQALLKRSSGTAAAPAELMLVQLAAKLAEEVAASSAGQL